MKILHFHPSMSGGGIEAMICGLANEMCRQGHDVTIGTIFKPKDTDIFWKRLSPKVEKFSLGKVKEGFSIKELFAIYKAIKRIDTTYIIGCTFLAFPEAKEQTT